LVAAISLLASAFACQQRVNISAPVTGLNGSIQVWLEAPAEARAGDLAPLTLYVKNLSDRTLEIWGAILPTNSRWTLRRELSCGGGLPSNSAFCVPWFSSRAW
jgi:hypothetical protein